jgi:dephospho-CoA kinase
MKLIGITGGIGTGKSTVSQILQEAYNVPVIYVDKLAREVVEPGSVALEKLVDTFGVEILLSAGSLDRAKLRAITIHNSAKMDAVTNIVWPEIGRQMKRMITNFEAIGAKVVCVENAALIEYGNYELYDDVVVVTCRPEIQLERVMARDNQSETDAKAMINIQMPLYQKEAFATVLITNNSGLSVLRSQVDALYEGKIK